MTTTATPLRAALLTPVGRGAVAVVGLCGHGVARAVAKHFAPAHGDLAKWPIGRIRFGRWQAQPHAPRDIGEELVVCRRGDDEFEIDCHGGTAAAAAVLESLAADGATVVDWREWLAASSGDETTAEALSALASAQTARIADLILTQADGALDHALDEIRSLADAGDKRTARSRAERLVALAALGRRLGEPFRVVLTGRPNVGKSSLINALVGYRRAVVFDTPGTTRDVVTASTVFDGWPVELSDTAGMRMSADALEQAGMDAARRRLAEADLVVAVFDLSVPWCNDDAKLLATHPGAIIVHNKADLAANSDDGRPEGLRVAAIDGRGIDELMTTIVTRLVPDPPKPGEALPLTPRQEALVRQVLTTLAP